MVLRMLGLGFTEKEIAARTGTTRIAVNRMTARIRTKLGIDRKAVLVRFAVKCGIVRA